MASKKNSRKQQNPRRGSGKSSGRDLVIPGQLFPPRMIRTLRYAALIDLTEASAGAVVWYLFTPSSLYDLDNTGTGHQPMFFDQICAQYGPYSKYRAIESKVKFTLANNSVYPTMFAHLVTPYISAPGVGTGTSSMQTALERPGSKSVMLGAAGGYKCTATSGRTIDHATALGISKQHLMTDDYYASVYSSSPTTNFALAFGVQSLGAGTAAVRIYVELQIKAEFFALANEQPS